MSLRIAFDTTNHQNEFNCICSGIADAVYQGIYIIYKR